MRTRPLLAAIVVAAAPAAAQRPAYNPADTVVGADAQVIPLWPNGAPGAVGDSTPVDRPTITVFPAARGAATGAAATGAAATGAAAVIFPGGGYQHLATGKEGVAVARWLNAHGVTAFVVRYRLGPRYHHPAMRDDALRAVRVVRARAAEWGVDRARVGVVGFSAGGHLASTAITHYGAADQARVGAADSVSARPDWAILVYPVISLEDPIAHKGSRTNLLGAAPDPAMVRAMSTQTQVNAQTPPTFLVTSTDDRTVPVENSLRFFEAMRAAKVPVELHAFESGPHGFGLAPGDQYLGGWPELAALWLRRRGVTR